MRIGIDARFYGGEQSKGLGRYTQKLVEHLLQLDHTNTYVLFVPDPKAPQLRRLAKRVELRPAPYRWYSIAEQLYMPWQIKRAKVDFMHFPHFNVPLWYKQPFIVTIHDLIISRFPTERATTLGPMMYWFKQRAYNSVIRHAALTAQHLITVSQYSKQDLMDYFQLPSERISVTYEAVDPFSEDRLSQDQPAAVWSRYKIQPPYFLYVGNAYPHKNLEILIDVVAALQKRGPIPWTIVCVGKPDYFYLRLQQKVWAKNVDRYFRFVGFVPDRDLPTLYRSALAYIFPSRYEGFGLPPLEAMLYGTPVLSAKTSCLPEVLGSAAAYFDFDDVDGIIRAITSITEHEDYRQQLIEQGFKQVQQYQWQRTAQQTLAIYESVFAQSHSKPSL